MFLPLTPVRCLARALDQYPNATAVVAGDLRFTYRDFAERCQRMAAGLVNAGMQPGDHVAWISFNTHALLESYFAVPMARGVLMPLNVRLHAAELAQILEHSKPKFLFYESEFAELVDVLRASAPQCRFLITDGKPPAGDGSYQELMQSDPMPWPALESFDENATAEVFYTSGSTGEPKGVMLSHRSLYLHALALASSFNHSDQEVVLHSIPLFHANGWGFPQFSALCGRKQVMIRRFEPETVFQLVERESVTLMILVPTMASALVHCAARNKYDLHSLKYIAVGGAISSTMLIEQMEKIFPGCTIEASYGLTETGPVLSTARPKRTIALQTDADRIRLVASTGWPLIGSEMRVADADLNDVPRDGVSVGEIIARGDNLMDGYYKAPELTRAALSGNWLRTGDMAVWNEEGCVQIVDRKKDIIISGGENIASLEVEAALLAHPAVAECAVVAAPDPKWGEVPVAVLVLEPGTAATQEELLAFAGGRLARFKLPRAIHFEDSPLPKTGTGKIMKTVLRERFWTGKERRVQG